MSRIERAIISVSDKTGLLPLARELARRGVEIVSTGGTAALLKQNGVRVTEISKFTGFPEILSGRVKTLHPKVHGGILSDRQSAQHRKQAKSLGIQPVDLVVVNLYPFEETAGRKGASMEELIEQIDIGGVTLIRSAAKNHRSVAVLCRPAQYEGFLKELEAKGGLSEESRLRLAIEAFAETAYYDSVIHQALAHRFPERLPWPERLVLAASKKQGLRYGENPHQPGHWYGWPSSGPTAGGLNGAKQLHGKELSFNNLLDLDAALRLVFSFKRPASAVVKHSNPCGAAVAGTPAEAFRRALECDPLSAFGGIIGFNRPVDAAAAKAVLAAGFMECVVAPGYRPDALRLLQTKKNLRVVQVAAGRRPEECLDLKQISGGLLLQEPDDGDDRPARWRSVTPVHPTAAQKKDLVFAWAVARHVKSNAIVVAKGERTVGIGMGLTSRVDSVEFALKKAAHRARGAVLASDAFFPKPDGPQAAARAGIRAIVQPGGSVQDPEVIKVARKARVAMLFTGERHFKH